MSDDIEEFAKPFQDALVRESGPSMEYVVLMKKLMELQAKSDKLAEAASKGGFHHNLCPYYRGEECMCANKHLKQALKEYRGE